MLSFIIEGLKSIVDLLKKRKESKKTDLEIKKLERDLQDQNTIVKPTFEDIKKYDHKTTNLIRSAEEVSKIKEAPGAGCFIATRVYGGDEHPNVVILRQFRDSILSKYRIGRYLKSVYDFIGPSLSTSRLFRNTGAKITRNILDTFCHYLDKK